MRVLETAYPFHYLSPARKMNRRDFLATCVRLGTAAALPFMLPTEIFGGVETVVASGLEKKHTMVQVSEKHPVIFIWLVGGPSKYETFDPASSEIGASNYAVPEIRGILNSIQTAVPGVHIGEHLPLTAQRMQNIAIVKTVVHTNHDHEEAQSISLTGSKDFKSGTKIPLYTNPFARHSQEYSVNDLKTIIPYTTINARTVPRVSEALQADSFLFAQCNLNDLGPSPLGSTVDLFCLGQRMNLHNQLNQLGIKIVSKETKKFDEQYSKASALFHNASLDKAFNISNQELEAAESRYGKSRTGHAFYLARRLVENGAQFVSIETENWDDHGGINTMMRNRLSRFDPAFSALVDDVSDFTYVVLCGEFGRTPRINSSIGRDHWPYSNFVVVSGPNTIGQSLGEGGNSRDIRSGVPLHASLLGESALRLGGCARVWLENNEMFPCWQDNSSGFFNRIFE